MTRGLDKNNKLYEEAIIYIITFKHSCSFYIGSTNKTLYDRLCCHIANSRNKTHKLASLLNVYERDDVTISGLQYYDNIYKHDLRRIEQDYLDKYKPDLNMVKAFEILDKKGIDAQYYTKNKDDIIKRTATYYEANKEVISIKNKNNRIVCQVCNFDFNHKKFGSHMTNKHSPDYTNINTLVECPYCKLVMKKRSLYYHLKSHM